MRCLRIIPSTTLLFAGYLHGQIADIDRPIPVAVRNISKLEVKVAVDHPVYAPGEVMTFTFTLRNPTSQSLQVPRPFWNSRAGFDLMEKNTERSKLYGTEFTYASPHPYANYAPLDDDLILLQPFETVSRTIRSDQEIRPGTFAVAGQGAPYRTGDYRVSYSYSPSAYASFSVGPALLERFTGVALSAESAEEKSGAKNVSAFVLAVGSDRLVFRTLDPSRPPKDLKSKFGKEWTKSEVDALRPYERVADATGPVVALELVPDTQPGTVSLRWQDSSGQHEFNSQIRRIAEPRP